METEVSFICTVKNAEVFIIGTIDSIIKQTISNWELVIVDDGSTDNTIKLIKAVTIKDDRIKLIETGGIGRGKALNLAISNTVGHYIANIDSDDPSHPQRAEIQVKMLSKNKQFSLVASNSFYIEEGTVEIPWDIYQIEQMNINIKDITATPKTPFRKEPINHSSVMFRKKDLLEAGKYNENRKFQFDAELWIRFSLKGKKIGLIPLRLSSKRIHPNQSFEIKNRKRYLKSSLELNLKLIRDFNLSPKYYIKSYIKYFYGFLPKSIRKSIKMLMF